MAQGARGHLSFQSLPRCLLLGGGEGKDGEVSHHPSRSAPRFQTWDPETLPLQHPVISHSQVCCSLRLRCPTQLARQRWVGGTLRDITSSSEL